MTHPAPRPTGAARFDLTPFERWEAVTLDDVHVGFLHRVLEDGVLTTRMGGFQWLALVGSAAIMTLGAVSMLGVDDAAGRAAATLVAEKPAVADPVAVATAHVD